MPNAIHTKLKQTENNIFFNLSNGLATLTQYILNNPGKAMALSHAGQVIGSLAAIEQRVAPALNLICLNQTDATQMEAIPDWLGTNDTKVDEHSHRTK